MKRSDFHFDLPSELIAQKPLERRSDSRLLRLTPGEASSLRDSRFTDLPSYLRAGDLLVFNNTRVIPARLYGRKETGGAVEIMLERLLSDSECLAMLRASKTPKPGSLVLLLDGSALTVLGREGSFFHLRLENGGLSEKTRVPRPHAAASVHRARRHPGRS